jgi:hypothetical protein
MAPSVSGLYRSMNNDYAIWIVAAILTLFGLYKVSASTLTLLID